MRYRYLALASALFFTPSIALAQTAKPADAPTQAPAEAPAQAPAQTPAETAPAQKPAETPAVATPDTANPDAPVKGKNSFTEDQAKERFEKAGYADVTGLALNDDGIWEGSATKDGGKVTVQLDYQGNITTKAM